MRSAFTMNKSKGRSGSIFISVIKKQSGKLIHQPVYFHQRGKSTYSSACSPLRGTMPARLRMASKPDRLTSKEIVTEIGKFTAGH